MPISEAHSNAARENGKLGQGPTSTEGKQSSSQNARKHSIFAAVVFLSKEDQQIFQELFDAFVSEYQPKTVTELRYVRELADAEFRLARVRIHAAEIQAKAMNEFADSQTPASDAFQYLAENSKSLQLLMRYERMFQNQFDKALKILRDLRKHPIAATPAKAPDPEPKPAEEEGLSARVGALERMLLGFSKSKRSNRDDESFNETDEFDELDDLQNEPSNPTRSH